MADEPKLPRGVISRNGNGNQKPNGRRRSQNVWRRYVADCGKPMSAAILIFIATAFTAVAHFYNWFQYETVTVWVASLVGLYAFDLGLRFYCKSQQWYSDNPGFWKVWWASITQNMLTTGLILVIVVLLVVATKDTIGSYYDSFTSSWPFSWLFSQSDNDGGSTPPKLHDAISAINPDQETDPPTPVLGDICPTQHMPSRIPDEDSLEKWFPNHTRLFDHLKKVWKNGCFKDSQLVYITEMLEEASKQSKTVSQVQYCLSGSRCYSAEDLVRLVNSNDAIQLELLDGVSDHSRCYLVTPNYRLPENCNPGLSCLNGSYESKRFRNCKRT